MSEPGHSHERHRALGAMIWCELLAFACSLAAALLADSLTLWANCLRVGLDLPASFFALYVSGRILRRQHGNFDYGLGKWENFAALINVPVMFAGLIFLAFGAVQSFLNPRPVTHTGFGMVVLLVFAVVNITLVLRFHRLQRRSPSPLVYAQFVMYRNATAASLLSILALLGTRLAGPLGTYFDLAGAVLLSFLIIQSAVLLLRQSLSALLDETVEDSLRERIQTSLAKSVQDYRKLHHIRSRHAGDLIFVELFVEFDPEISVREMIHSAGRIRSEIEGAISGAAVTVIPCESELR